jgi:propanol-preferring alcohol dehydrogenase
VAVRERPANPAAGDVTLATITSGVCRTDLHVVTGDLPLRRRRVTPGHQVVGEVVAVGDGVTELAVGDRVGVGWVRETCGTCKQCRRGRENLCPATSYTGWSADGGYTEQLSVPAGAVHRLPDGYSDLELAPLLCAGISGYRAVRLAELTPGDRLGIYGFGSSAHLAAQYAMAHGAVVHVVTRSAAGRELALSLGAASASPADRPPPEPLDAAIVFAPSGAIVPRALEALDRGGILVLAGIYVADVPALTYERHLFYERQVRTSTAHTRDDALEFLAFAAGHRLTVAVRPYSLGNADRALTDLDEGRITGAAVLQA